MKRIAAALNGHASTVAALGALAAPVLMAAVVGLVLYIHEGDVKRLDDMKAAQQETNRNVVGLIVQEATRAAQTGTLQSDVNSLKGEVRDLRFDVRDLQRRVP